MAEKNDKEIQAKLTYPPLTEEDKPIYANYVMISHTPWDFTIHFGNVVSPFPTVQAQSLSDPSTIEIPVRKVQSVNIPATLIKGLIDALQAQLEKYERSYGQITIPKQKEKK